MPVNEEPSTLSQLQARVRRFLRENEEVAEELGINPDEADSMGFASVMNFIRQYLPTGPTEGGEHRERRKGDTDLDEVDDLKDLVSDNENLIIFAEQPKRTAKQEVYKMHDWLQHQKYNSNEYTSILGDTYTLEEINQFFRERDIPYQHNKGTISQLIKFEEYELLQAIKTNDPRLNNIMDAQQFMENEDINDYVMQAAQGDYDAGYYLQDLAANLLHDQIGPPGSYGPSLKNKIFRNAITNGNIDLSNLPPMEHGQQWQQMLLDKSTGSFWLEKLYDNENIERTLTYYMNRTHSANWSPSDITPMWLGDRFETFDEYALRLENFENSKAYLTNRADFSELIQDSGALFDSYYNNYIQLNKGGYRFEDNTFVNQALHLKKKYKNKFNVEVYPVYGYADLEKKSDIVGAKWKGKNIDVAIFGHQGARFGGVNYLSERLSATKNMEMFFSENPSWQPGDKINTGWTGIHPYQFLNDYDADARPIWQNAVASVRDNCLVDNLYMGACYMGEYPEQTALLTGAFGATVGWGQDHSWGTNDNIFTGVTEEHLPEDLKLKDIMFTKGSKVKGWTYPAYPSDSKFNYSNMFSNYIQGFIPKKRWED